MSMQANPFYLVSVSNDQIAVQAGHGPGYGVTLQRLDRRNAHQLWVFQPQVGGGLGGVALVNPATRCSAQGTAAGNDVVMQLFAPGSQDFDTWVPAAVDPNGGILIPWTNDRNQLWNAWGGGIVPGTPIKLWHGTANNSRFRIMFAPVSADQTPEIADEVPALAGEPAAV